MQKSLIIGFGLTGKSLARFLTHHGEVFDVFEESETLIQSIKETYPTAEILTHVKRSPNLKNYNVFYVSPGIAEDNCIIQFAHQHKIRCTSDIEIFCNLLENQKIIAITGSNGKSTVTKCLEFVLRSSGLQATAAGNIGQPVLDQYLEEQTKATKTNIWVLELSSFQLEKYPSIQTECAVVLNVSDDHLDRHSSLQQYASIKRTIYHYTKNPIINREDSNSYPNYLKSQPSFGTNCPAENTLDYGIKNHCLYRGNNKLLAIKELSVLGEHNALNALVVWMIARLLTINDQQIATHIVLWVGLEHRFETALKQRGITWINDSKGTNVGALLSSIKGSQSLIPSNTTPDKKLIIIIGGITKGASFSSLNKSLEQYAKTIILFGQDKELIYKDLSNVQTIIKKLENLDEIVSHAKMIAQSGDIVLFSPGCSSFDMFKNFEDRGRQFKQKVIELILET